MASAWSWKVVEVDVERRDMMRCIFGMPSRRLLEGEQKSQLRLPDPVARAGMLHGAQRCMEGDCVGGGS